MHKYQINNNITITNDSLLKFTSLNLLRDGDEATTYQKKRIAFHAENKDYFGTVATIINVLRDDKLCSKKMRKRVLDNLYKDLIYLQDNYNIVKK